MVQFYHIIDLPDGTATAGVCDHRGDPSLLGIDKPALLAGKCVLDIAANDGFWSFWAERAGAADVLAIDVENYQGYDWGYDGPPATELSQSDKAAAFWHLKTFLNSKVRRESIRVYDLDPRRHGIFDLVFHYGLLYHLRHPLLSLDVTRSVCRGCMVLETHIVLHDPGLPSSLFYMDDVFAGPTNWTGASEACVVHWMRSAGFPIIYRQRMSTDAGYARQRFIGAITEEWGAVFSGNPNFLLCDDQYFAATRERVRATVYRT